MNANLSILSDVPCWCKGVSSDRFSPSDGQRAPELDVKMKVLVPSHKLRALCTCTLHKGLQATVCAALLMQVLL